MPLSWNEIKTKATAFSKEWENEVSEDAEAKSFWDDFFNVFGIGRRRVATFEHAVKSPLSPSDRVIRAGFGEGSGVRHGFIDLLWKGVILIEHKSRGKDLDKAYQQAKDYFPGLKEKELPRYILVSDFERFRLYDLEENIQYEFKLSNFVNHVHLFGFIAGYQKRTYKEQDPVNIEAAELMGMLHDKLKAIGYDGHHLELYLVRLLFCLFADDSSIFERGIFNEYIELKTNEDGSDLAMHISQLFTILNTPKDNRFKNIDESLDIFPYVNGKLFEEPLPVASFDGEMRKILIDCCLLDWGKISLPLPAPFQLRARRRLPRVDGDDRAQHGAEAPALALAQRPRRGRARRALGAARHGHGRALARRDRRREPARVHARLPELPVPLPAFLPDALRAGAARDPHGRSHGHELPRRG